MFNRYVTADVNFLLQNPEAIEKVLLQLYRIETKVLDLSKWKSDNPSSKMSTSGVAKVTTYGTRYLNYWCIMATKFLVVL